MKELLDIIKNYGITPLVYGVGIFALGLFTLSLIPSWSWLPKAFILFALTH